MQLGRSDPLSAKRTEPPQAPVKPLETPPSCNTAPKRPFSAQNLPNSFSQDGLVFALATADMRLGGVIKYSQGQTISEFLCYLVLGGAQTVFVLIVELQANQRSHIHIQGMV